MEIAGKKALVTGASSGIGRASAIMLAQRGATGVTLVDRDAEGLKAVAAEISALGATPIMKVVDLRTPGAVARVFREADAEMQGLDIVHNNAGVMSGSPDFAETDLSRMVAVIEVNLMAMMVGVRIATDLMRSRQASGVIVNTSSTVAFAPLPADPAYCASKHGLNAFVQSCKPLHERFGIRVMAICPGIVDTAIVPRDQEWLQPALAAVKMLRPEEVAAHICAIVENDALSGDFVIVSNENPGV